MYMINLICHKVYDVMSSDKNKSAEFLNNKKEYSVGTYGYSYTYRTIEQSLNILECIFLFRINAYDLSNLYFLVFSVKTSIQVTHIRKSLNLAQY